MDETVTVSLSVDEAILVSAIAHRWEVQKQLRFENVSEYYSLMKVGNLLSSQDAVARHLWGTAGEEPSEARPNAERHAAEKVANQLRTQGWPPECFERYPPRAYIECGYEYKLMVAADANANDYVSLVTGFVQHLAKQMSISGDKTQEAAQHELSRSVLERLQQGNG